MIDGKSFLISRLKMILEHINFNKISLGQGDGYTCRCLLDYNFFKEHYEKVAIDLSEQEELDSDPKAIQQTNFAGNLSTSAICQQSICQSAIFVIIKEAKETALDFLQ